MTVTKDLDPFSNTMTLKWEFVAGAGPQVGDAESIRGWTIVSSEFTITNAANLPQCAIQITNGSAGSDGYTDVDGLVIASAGSIPDPQLLKPSSTAITEAIDARAYVTTTIGAGSVLRVLVLLKK